MAVMLYIQLKINTFDALTITDFYIDISNVFLIYNST